MRQPESDEFTWIQLAGDKSSLPGFQEFILEQAEKLEIEPAVIGKIELILEEVLLNIINYAYTESQAGTIRAGCALFDRNRFVIRIIDQGKPFDPSSSPDPDTTLSIEERGIGGLGIYLVHQLSDKVSYQRVDGQNILDITFKT
ncbi:MAG: ATP-binding protein [Desulfonatronovibrio sp.]